MTDHEGNVLNHAIEELRTLPSLDQRRVSRIVAAAVAGRAVGVDETVAPYLPPLRPAIWRMSTILGIGAAAGIGGFVLRGMLMGSSLTVPSQPNGPGPAITTTIRSTSAELRPVPTQFVYTNAGARAVRVIGDFNGWGSTPSPMVRGPDGVWSAIQPIVPGRHLYAFVVDDSARLDPHAATARDPDYGVVRSVIIVGKP